MRMPMSEPPKPPTSWWKTTAGQLSLLVIVGGLVLIFCVVFGTASGQFSHWDLPAR